jgi:membrane protein YqaA with SNARE-associated domain
MLKALYDWTLSLAARKSAQWWLGFISFVESSVFVVPAEALLVPMGLARPERAYRYALITSVGSVLGGVAGWFHGYYAYELIARPVLEFYGSLDKFEVLRSSASRDAILIMLITSGVAHLPPMKVVTILSGAAAVDIWLFIASAIVARGGKFFVIAWLLCHYGEPIREFIEKRLALIAFAGVVALLLLYFAVRMFFDSLH